MWPPNPPPAVTPQVSFMLGQNALGLGLWGLLAPKGVNRFLGLKAAPQTTQLLFGAREMATGMALFSDPTKSSALWARVAGDIFDIAVLSALSRASNPKRGNARLALGDTQLRRNMGKATQAIRGKRAAVVNELPDWEALREAGRAAGPLQRYH